MSPIEQEIAAFLATEADVGEIAPSTSLLESGLIDSAAVLSLVAFLEERYAVELDPVDINLDNFDTIAAIARLVAMRRG